MPCRGIDEATEHLWPHGIHFGREDGTKGYGSTDLHYAIPRTPPDDEKAWQEVAPKVMALTMRRST